MVNYNWGEGMNREELQTAITATLAKIEQLKAEIEQNADAAQRQKLIRRKKELQYLQLWHIEQLEAYQDR